MHPYRCAAALAAVFVFMPLVQAQVKPSAIDKQLGTLRSLPEDKRPSATTQLAKDIATLPAGNQKLGFADRLCHLSTEGDLGRDTIQAVADTLAQALKETPVPAKNDKVPMPYMDLAKLVRYEGAQATLDDPLFAKAQQALQDDEASLEHVDFTLKDGKGKATKLSDLRGKIVMVNFWATWCAPCRVEMPELDMLQGYFEKQGLVVLSITDEEIFKVGQVTSTWKYRPTILFDRDGAVYRQFHVTGIPSTYLFGRDGKLLAVALDQRTRRQFLEMLSKTDLHPE